MKKVFEAEYPDDLNKQITEWVEEQTVNEDGSLKVFRPYAVVELFDQNGEPI